MNTENETGLVNIIIKMTCVCEETGNRFPVKHY